jgi:acyl-homoserine-lactone acylase
MILADTCISFDELVGYKLNTGMEAADRFLDDLGAAVELYPDSLATKAMSVLREWDRKTDADSKGAILFAKWFDRVDFRNFRIPWQAANAVSTPDGFLDPKKEVDHLIQAALETLDQYGSLDVSWGSVHRFRMNNLDLPANGGPEKYGIFRTIDYRGEPDLKKRAVSGDSYVAVTEFGDPVRAMVLMSYGNATQAGNKHRGDQVALLSEKKMRPALLRRENIIQNLEEREELFVIW